jgi:DNA-binding phage protein
MPDSTVDSTSDSVVFGSACRSARSRRACGACLAVRTTGLTQEARPSPSDISPALVARNLYVTFSRTMPRRSKTGFDKFFDAQMKSPSFAKSYAEARAEVDAIDGLVRALNVAREKSGLSKTDLATAIEARPEIVRRLFTQRNPNPTLSTFIRLAAALGYRVELVREAGHRARRRSRAAA